MEEKRLSIRFRMDNPQDKEAWELLQRISAEENISKNAAALRLICNGAVSAGSTEIVSLEVVAEKEPQTDEFRAVSKEALSFLDEF